MTAHISALDNPEISDNFYEVLCYHQKRLDKKDCKIIDKQLIFDTSPETAASIFRLIAPFVFEVSPQIFHVSLCFDPTDYKQLKEAGLQKISQEYLEGLGYGEQPYIMYRYNGTAYPHIHILSTRVAIKTRIGMDDCFEDYHSKEVLYQLEQKYGLTPAPYQSENHHEIRVAIWKALQSKPTNYEKLNAELAKNGSNYSAKKVGRGLVYYPIDKTEKSKQQHWKSTDFKELGFHKKGIEQLFEEYKQQLPQTFYLLSNTEELLPQPLQNYFNLPSK